MDWKREAINDLRAYQPRKRAMENITKRIAALNEQYGALRSSASDSNPVQGGGTRMEDALINNIAERERLRRNRTATKWLLELTERGLSGLDERQKDVLEGFYINPSTNHVETLMEKLSIEKSHLYRVKDDALYRFTISMYGLIDT